MYRASHLLFNDADKLRAARREASAIAEALGLGNGFAEKIYSEAARIMDRYLINTPPEEVVRATAYVLLKKNMGLGSRAARLLASRGTRWMELVATVEALVQG